MNLLVDAHALIWFLEDDPALSQRARAAIASEANTAFISHATAWEICIKHALGKLGLPIPYDQLFPGRLEELGFLMLPINHSHFNALLRLPFHHRDPFDRLLIAQAEADGLTLVSHDQHFPAYGVPLLW